MVFGPQALYAGPSRPSSGGNSTSCHLPYVSSALWVESLLGEVALLSFNRVLIQLDAQPCLTKSLIACFKSSLAIDTIASKHQQRLHNRTHR